MDHMKLLCDFGELSWTFNDSASIESFLQKIVAMVADHMNAAVCSIYLYDENIRKLILRATKGLSLDAINRVKLDLGEGLTGLALKELRPVSERLASKHPSFKAIPGINEERYDSFMAVPIVRGLSRIGVLTLQRETKKFFDENDVMAMRVIATQLANILEIAKLLMTLDVRQPVEAGAGELEELKFIKGKVASKGFAFGPATIIDRDGALKYLSRKKHAPCTLDDFRNGLSETAGQLTALQRRVEERLSDAASLIFTSHLLILKDRMFVGAIEDLIAQGLNPPEAIIQVAMKYISLFSTSANLYIREKSLDVEDLVARLIGNVTGDPEDSFTCRDRVVVARELFPSDLLMMSSEMTQGAVLVTGGATSHLAFLARSLAIPMVIVESPRLLDIPRGTPIILDAELGNVYVNPAPDVVQKFKQRNETRLVIAQRPRSVSHQTVTRDGTVISLLANINLLTDLEVANEPPCQGIGLYRTEFPFIIRANFPAEEEQYVIYRKLVEGMAGKVVTFRTLDIGGDKVLSYFPGGQENNPFLGMRSIRFTLWRRDLFISQIRAMLRAGAGANLKIMFPMISSLEEFQMARQIVDECVDGLNRDGIEHNPHPGVGMMIEVPSVLDLIDDFAAEVDFFSLGTNDLVQYLLAVDRTNEKVADLYIPHHPAVMRAIYKATTAAARAGKEISICGDMAQNERYTTFLIGAGVRVLSMDPVYIGDINNVISSIDVNLARGLVEKILRMNKATDIATALDEANGLVESNYSPLRKQL